MRSFTFILCLIIFFTPLTSTQAQNQPYKSFDSLFNGQNLQGWIGYQPNQDPRKIAALSDNEKTEYENKMRQNVNKHWSVKNGAIISDGHGVHLATQKKYTDFELFIDYKLGGPTVDSGIYLRDNPQVQIWNPNNKTQTPHGNAKGSGGLWNNPPNTQGRSPAIKADKPVGQWNTFRILMVGSFVTIYLNGQCIVDHAEMHNFFDKSKPIFKKGHIQLQTHGGIIHFKNIYIREIKSNEANMILRSKNQGLNPIFNGKDLAGWGGHGLKDYNIEHDGSLHCRKGASGNLRYEKQLANFHMDFAFKLQPGSNNGLGIRYEANKNAAYHGMELQILDNSAEKYKNLRPDQYHASCTGFKPAHRGFQRPVGHWNYQYVIADGSKIKVYLNGFRVLDIDLSKIGNPVDGQKHPGIHNKKGHIGFLGHNDEIWLKGIRVKELK